MAREAVSGPTTKTPIYWDAPVSLRPLPAMASIEERGHERGDQQR
jgi:hypothetical protein